MLRSLLPIAASLLLAGCSAEPAPQDGGAKTSPASVTLQLNWLPEPQFGGIYQAALDGVFDEEGLDVTIQPGAAGVSAPQLADSGRVEFSVVGGSQVLQLNDRGGALVALFAVYQHDPHGIMVRSDSEFESLAELWRDPEATIGCEAELASCGDRSARVEDGADWPPTTCRPSWPAPSRRPSASSPRSRSSSTGSRPASSCQRVRFDPYNTVLVTRRAYRTRSPRSVLLRFAPARGGALICGIPSGPLPRCHGSSRMSPRRRSRSRVPDQ